MERTYTAILACLRDKRLCEPLRRKLFIEYADAVRWCEGCVPEVKQSGVDSFRTVIVECGNSKYPWPYIRDYGSQGEPGTLNEQTWAFSATA